MPYYFRSRVQISMTLHDDIFHKLILMPKRVILLLEMLTFYSKSFIINLLGAVVIFTLVATNTLTKIGKNLFNLLICIIDMRNSEWSLFKFNSFTNMHLLLTLKTLISRMPSFIKLAKSEDIQFVRKSDITIKYIFVNISETTMKIQDWFLL